MAKEKSGIAGRAERLCSEVIESLGYELVDVSYKKEGRDFHLTFYVDRRGGIGLDDCEKISLAIDPILDRELEVPQSYLMSVSSPGLDRPYKTERDFLRHIGDLVEVSLYQAYEGQQKLEAYLRSYEAGDLELEFEDGRHLSLAKGRYAQVKPAIRF
ncbi:MAG: ribosome maturation factor RimP [Eubacteriales bacterium]|nr:ribosome maturation factor RimP [Eubacteriales bacterium]